MKTITPTAKYLGLDIEYTADIYPPDVSVGYTSPIVEKLEIQSFGGIDWETIASCLHTFVIDSIETRCHEHAIELAMSEGVV